MWYMRLWSASRSNSLTLRQRAWWQKLSMYHITQYSWVFAVSAWMASCLFISMGRKDGGYFDNLIHLFLIRQLCTSDIWTEKLQFLTWILLSFFSVMIFSGFLWPRYNFCTLRSKKNSISYDSYHTFAIVSQKKRRFFMIQIILWGFQINTSGHFLWLKVQFLSFRSL